MNAITLTFKFQDSCPPYQVHMIGLSAMYVRGFDIALYSADRSIDFTFKDTSKSVISVINKALGLLDDWAYRKSVVLYKIKLEGKTKAFGHLQRNK